jgi:hypothetical protein
MTESFTLVETAEPPSGDFTPEPAPCLSDWVNEGIVQAKEAQRDVLTAIDTLTQMLAQSARASTECQLRMIAMAQTNAVASYELAREMIGASSWARLIEVSADGARRQAETAASQLRELSDLVRKAATETTEPLSANIARVFKQAA